MKCLPAILLLALLAAPARAGWLPQFPFASDGAAQNTAVHPAVVRIVAPGRDSTSYGSGTLVAKNDKHGLVITNWHVINELTGQLVVIFPDGYQSAGTVLKADRDWDLAAITIWRPNVEPVRLATAAPQQGETLTIAGYGPGKYRAASGKCTQYVAPGPKFPFEIVELAATARQGDSGGPIFNSRGEMAGVLFGEGHGRTAGSYCGRVQWFLASVVPAQELGGDKTMIAARDAQPAPLTSSAGGRVIAQPISMQAASPGAPLVRVPSLARMKESQPTEQPDFRAMQPSPIPVPARQPQFAAPVPPRMASLPPQTPLGSGSATRSTSLFGRSDSAEPAAPARHRIGWTDIAGDTRGQQLKTVFAAVGVAAFLLHALSWLGSAPSKPEEKKPKKRRILVEVDDDDDDDDDDDEDDDDDDD